MLSIPGRTYGEVFRCLTNHESLDTKERHAAAQIATWFDEWDCWTAAKSEACHEGDHTAWEAASRETDRLMRSRPFIGNHLSDRPQEWRSFVLDDVKFTIYPYTCGATMNVGVDRLVRAQEAR